MKYDEEARDGGRIRSSWSGPATHMALAAWLLVLVGCAPVTSYDGASLYQRNCAVCHGVYGEGDGPAAAYVAIVPRDLRRMSESGRFPRDEIIALIDGRSAERVHGTRDMPMWGDAFVALDGSAGAESRANAKIEALADYLQSIQLTESE